MMISRRNFLAVAGAAAAAAAVPATLEGPNPKGSSSSMLRSMKSSGVFAKIGEIVLLLREFYKKSVKIL